MTEFVGAIDQGTTSTRFMIFDRSGREVARSQKEHEQILPRPGWVEHDPQEILKNTEAVIKEAFEQGGLTPERLVAVGITNQRETSVLWDGKSGQPVYNAIVWQDTRTDRIISDIKRRGEDEIIRVKAGLPTATYFSAGKVQWLIESVPEVSSALRKGNLLFGNIDTWLIWNLTGGAQGGKHVTDVTNASRTMLMDLKTRQWDSELLEIFEIPADILPEILPSSDSQGYGVTRIESLDEVPICGDLGDQQAATVGQVCFQPGEAKNTYGTGNFLLLNTGTEAVVSQSGLLTTVAYQFGKEETRFALEGSIAVTGSAVQWLRDQLQIIEQTAEVESLANQVEDSGGIYFVPAFSGLFAPYWRQDARGVIVGLSRYVTDAHLARATLEAICYQTRDVVEAMEKDAGVELEVLRVDGGATANDTLMQLQADILGVPVVRPAVSETTSLGAAYAAGLAVGFWKGLDDLRENWSIDREWTPNWSEDRRRTAYAGWKKAVERTLDWLE